MTNTNTIKRHVKNFEWGLGVEHEFLVQNDDTGALLTPNDVFNGTNMGDILSITAPAGGKLSKKKLLMHARYYCKLVIEKIRDADGTTYPSENEVDEMGLDQILKLLKDWLRMFSNDTIYTYNWGDVYEVTLIGCDHSCKQLTPEEAMCTYAALRERVLKKRRDSDSGENDHDIDGSFIETRSTMFKNATVEDVLTQLHNAEEKVLDKARKNGFKNVRIYPWSGNVSEKGEPRYLGSYHVWITLPNLKTPRMTIKHRSDILLKHGCLTHLLQWIEPLLMTLFTGDPRALGSDDDNFVRASMRARHSNYSGYGTTIASRIAYDRDIGDSMYIRWYETDDDLLMDKNSRHQRLASWPLYVWVDGTKVRYQQCMMGQRMFGYGGDLYGFQPVVSKRSYIEPRPGDGADIRSELCNSLGIKLSGAYAERWLRVKDTLELRFVNTNTNEIVRDVPIEKGSWGNEIRGIEFRAIDNMPPSQIDGLLHLMALVAAAALAKCTIKKLEFDKNAAALSPHWHKALHDVRRLGTHCPVNCNYITKLASELGVDVKCRKDFTMFDALLVVSESLHSAFKDSECMKMMHPSSSHMGPPVFDNVGQTAWQEAWDAADEKIRKKATNNPRNAPYIKYLKINHKGSRTNGAY
jgi:hypothetical protein